jgi:CheY-like chemotaxis protein
MRILYVEDDELNFRLVERVLGFDGHEVFRAGDGIAALQFVRSIRPDLVLMELWLPGIDGFETARRMRQLAALAGTPIVALTCMTQDGQRQRALAEGFDGFVAKPFRVATLRSEMQRFADGARRAAPAPEGT